MSKTVARQKVNWCNRAIEWTAISVDDQIDDSPRNAMWSYRLEGLTYYGFPFDPGESGSTTRERALNWLNRHHLLLRRELLTMHSGS